jgi:hypothetical protein
MSPCDKCKWYRKRREHVFSSLFVNGSIDYFRWTDKKKLTPYPMCHHPVCFSTEEICPCKAKLKRVKERIQGQYQLIEDGECPYFKKRWLW